MSGSPQTPLLPPARGRNHRQDHLPRAHSPVRDASGCKGDRVGGAGLVSGPLSGPKLQYQPAVSGNPRGTVEGERGRERAGWTREGSVRARKGRGVAGPLSSLL